MQRWPLFLFFIAVVGCEQACPSEAGGYCDPRGANCPPSYVCAMAEICTRPCEQTSDCWIKVEDGCRFTELPGQRSRDGGVFMESSENGFCPAEVALMECLEGHCQRFECADGGCDRDLYGPSGAKGNRDQGPQE